MKFEIGFIIISVSILHINAKFEKRFRLPFMDAAALDGYYAEEHEVITEDGNILVHHRIPYAKNSTVQNKRPIFIVPGLTATSDCFIMNENYSIAYILAERGHDVWLLNLRGNKYSNRHVKYNSKRDKEYWNFCLHETGYYDVPASVDYILNMTKAEKITGIGHSQGSTTLFLWLSSRPEYNDKVNLLIHFGPSAYLNDSHVETLKILGRNSKFLDYLVRDVLNIHNMPDSQTGLSGIESLCTSSAGLKYFCSVMVNSIDYGANVEEIYDKDIFPLVLSHMPSGICVKLCVHYFQLIQTGLFRNFDYGRTGNLERYGSENPTTYDIKSIKVPSALFYSPDDVLLPLSGIKRLIRDLQKPLVYEITHKNFRHIVYIFSKLVHIIFPDLFDLLDKYSH